MAADAAAVAAAHLSAGVTPPRRLAPIAAATVSAKLPLRHTEPQPQPEPSPPALSGSPPRLLAGGVRGVDDDGNAAPPWGWDWCAIFPPESASTSAGEKGSHALSQRRRFVHRLRRAELSVKTIKRFGGVGRTFVLIGCREGRLKEEADRIKLRVRQSTRYGSDHLMPYAIFRTSEPPDRYERFVDPNKCFFDSYHRKLLIESIISTAGHLTNNRTAGLKLDRLMQQRKLQEFFPLHEPRKLGKLNELNDARCRRCRCFRSSGRQPLDLLRNYLGDQWAIYFAWLELYTNLLLIPSVVGCGVYIYTLLRADQDADRQGALDSIWSLAFSFFLCGWGCVWRDLWKRKNSALVYRWGTKGVQRAERVRSDFLGHEDGHLALEVPPERSGAADGEISVTPAQPISFGQHSTLVLNARWEPNSDSGNKFVRLVVTAHVSNRRGTSEYQREGHWLDDVVHKEGDLVRISSGKKGVPDDEKLYRVAHELEDEHGGQRHVFHLVPAEQAAQSNSEDGEAKFGEQDSSSRMGRVRSRLSSMSMLLKCGPQLIPTLSRQCTVGQQWATFTIVDRTIAEAQSIDLERISIAVVGAGAEGGTLQFASLSVRQARTFQMDNGLGIRKLQKARKYVRLLHGRSGAQGRWTVPAGWSSPVWKAADAGWWWFAAAGLVLGICCGTPVAYCLIIKYDLQVVIAILAGAICCIVVLFAVLYVRMTCIFYRKVDDSDDKGVSDSLYRARRFGIYSGPTFIELEEFHEFFSDAYAAFSGHRSAVIEEHHQPPFYPRNFSSWFGWTHFVTRTIPKQATIAVFVLLVAIGTLLLLILKDYLRNQYPDSFTAMYGGSALNAVFILIMDNVWKVIARRLTDLENHRTESEYTDAMIRTTFAFQFVSNYLSLFYIAFIKGNLRTFDNYLPFEPAPCDCSEELVGDTVLCCRAELYAQLVSLVVLRQAYGNVKEVLVPWIAHKCSQRNLAKTNKTQEAQESQEAQPRAKVNTPTKVNQIAPADAGDATGFGKTTIKQRMKMEQESAIVGPVKQSTMKRHDTSMATFDEYNEMAIQFGYVVLFGMIFPLAPAMSLLNNLIEQWSDTWKVLNIMQRPRPQLVERIGAWESITNFLCYVAILTNSVLVAFATYQLENTFGAVENGNGWTLSEKLLGVCIMEHLLLMCKWLIEAVIADEPEWVTKAEARDDWIAAEEQRFLSARTVDSFEKGDHVRITKCGTKFGRCATVTDPDWAGRVKVQLQKDDSGKSNGKEQDDGVRSYHRDELELLEGPESESESDGSESEVDVHDEDTRLLVVHPLGLCMDGFAACDSVGRFCGGPFVGTDFSESSTGDDGVANNLVFCIDDEEKVVALDGHDLSEIGAAAKLLDAALMGVTVTTSCAGSFESLVVTSENYKRSDGAIVKVDSKASSEAAMALLGIVPAKFVGGTFVPHDFSDVYVTELSGAAAETPRHSEQLVVCVDGGQPQTVELHADCTDIADAARALAARLQPSATVSHRQFNITITSNAAEEGNGAGSVEIDRIGSSTNAKRLLGLLDSCSHCGSHPAYHSTPSDETKGGTAGDAGGEVDAGADDAGADNSHSHSSGHCGHCGSHPHHHRPKHQFHGWHRYG